MYQCHSEEFSQTASNDIFLIGIHLKQGLKFQDKRKQSWKAYKKAD